MMRQADLIGGLPGALPFGLNTALFPGARQLLSLTRFSRETKSAGDFKSETRRFIISLDEEKSQ